MPYQTTPDNTGLSDWTLWDTRFPDQEGQYALQTEGTGMEYCVVNNTETNTCATYHTAYNYTDPNDNIPVRGFASWKIPY